MTLLQSPAASSTQDEAAAALARIAPLDQARAMIGECRTDLERLRLRDVGRAAQAAALILERRDVQVSASLLVQAAERAIHEANPAKPEGWQREKARGKGNTVFRGDGIDENCKSADSQWKVDLPASTLRDIRAVHSKLTRAQFDAAVSSAEAKQEPLTRKALAAVARAAAPKPKAKAPAPPAPDPLVPEVEPPDAKGKRATVAQEKAQAQAEARNPDLLIARNIELADQVAGQKTVITGLRSQLRHAQAAGKEHGLDMTELNSVRAKLVTCGTRRDELMTRLADERRTNKGLRRALRRRNE